MISSHFSVTGRHLAHGRRRHRPHLHIGRLPAEEVWPLVISNVMGGNSVLINMDSFLELQCRGLPSQWCLEQLKESTVTLLSSVASFIKIMINYDGLPFDAHFHDDVNACIMASPSPPLHPQQPRNLHPLQLQRGQPTVPAATKSAHQRKNIRIKNDKNDKQNVLPITLGLIFTCSITASNVTGSTLVP